MAYEPKTWECGEVITAEDLNHMEQGIEQASSGSADEVYVELTGTDEFCTGGNAVDLTLQASAQELYEYIASGKTVKVTDNAQHNPYGGKYRFGFTGGVVQMSAANANNQLQFSVVKVGQNFVQTVVFDPVASPTDRPRYASNTCAS